MINSDYLFELPKSSLEKIDILPVSVVDLSAQSQNRRETGGHNQNSSRSEYSHFPSEIASLSYDYFLRDCKTIFDPFAGWGERHESARKHNKNYIGYDINPIAIQKALEEYGVYNIESDSLIADIPLCDGVLTCPPYYNLEQYSNNGIDACDTWELFLEKYRAIWARIINTNPSATFCVFVGDWRKNNKYYDLTYQTRKIFESLNMQIFDEVIASRKSITKIKIMLPQAKRLGYTVKLHETLLVFKPSNNKESIPNDQG